MSFGGGHAVAGPARLMAAVFAVVALFSFSMASAAPAVKPKLTKVEFDSYSATGDVVLKFTGTDFKSGVVGTSKPDKDVLRLATTFTSSTSLKVTMSLDSFFKDGRILNIPFAVINPDNVESDAQPYKLALLKPTLSSLSPASMNVNASAKTVTVTGTNFSKKAKIKVGGSERATTWVSSSSVRFDLTDADVARGVTHDVTAVNPENITSEKKTLTVIYPLPTITSFSPETWTAGSPVTLTVQGTNFFPGVSQLVYRDGNFGQIIIADITIPADAIATSFVVTIPVDKVRADIAAPRIFVSNGVNRYSQNKFPKIARPKPVLESVEPSTIEAGTLSQKLVFKGKDFFEMFSALFDGNGVRIETQTATEATLSINQHYIGKAGKRKVALTYYIPGVRDQQRTNEIELTVVAARPKLTKVEYDSTDKDGNIVLKFTGSDFANGAIAGQKNDAAKTYPTVFVSSTQLRVTAPLADLLKDGKAENVPFKATNPDGKETDAQPFKLVLPKPSLTSLNPVSAAVNQSTKAVTVTGSNFIKKTIIRVGGTDRVTTYVSGTSLTFLLTDADVAAPATLDVTAVNPDGVSSDKKTFAVTPPAPALTAVSPDFTLVGSGEMTITLSGTGFTDKSIVVFGSAQWNVPTTYKSSTELEAKIPAVRFTQATTWDVGVSTPAPGGGYAALSKAFAVRNPAPTITSLTPASFEAGSAPATVLITGTGFIGTTDVKLNGQSLSRPNLPTATTVSAHVSLANAKPGEVLTFTVTNGAPGGGTSNEVRLEVVTPRPKLMKVEYDSTDKDGNAVLKFTGANFVTGAIAGQKDDKEKTYPTTFVSSTQLKVTVPLTDLLKNGKPDNIPFKVTNPDGKESDAQPYKHVLPRATLIKLIPDEALVGATARTVKAEGNAFLSLSVVRVGGTDRVTRFVSSTELSFDLTDADVAAAGAFDVTVAAPDGAVTSTKKFTVYNPAAQILEFSPNPWVVGSDVTLSATGVNFIPGRTIFTVFGPNDSILFTMTLPEDATPTFFRLTIPADKLPEAGTTVTLETANPAPSKSGTAVSADITAPNPTPVLTKLSTTEALIGDAAFDLTLTGTGFIRESKVKIGGKERATTYVDGKTLKVKLTSDDLKATGTIPFTVANPDPGASESGKLDLEVKNPAPTLTKLSDETKTVGSPAFDLTLTGTGFIKGSKAKINGTERSTTYVDGTTLRVQLRADDLAAVGDVSVSVTNPEPGGGASGALKLSVMNPTPSLDTYAPFQAYAGAADTPFVLTGSNFVATSVVRIGGVDVPTTFISATELRATMPASKLAAVGIVPVLVFTPAPGGGSSQTLGFSVVVRPGANLLAPADGETLQAGASYTIRWEITGSSYDRARLSLAKNGEEYLLIANDAGTGGSYSWTVPSATSDVISMTVDLFLNGTAVASDTAVDLHIGAAAIPAPEPTPEPEPTPTPAPSPEPTPAPSPSPAPEPGTPPGGGGGGGGLPPTEVPPSAPGSGPNPKGEDILRPPTTPKGSAYDYDPAAVFTATEGDWIDWTQTFDTSTPQCGLRKTLYKKRFIDTVWYCGWDGRLHAFQNPKIFFSWYAGFSTVKVVSSAILDALPKGDPVQYRPGGRLIKTPSDPRVYAVDKDWVLRLIPDETTARDLYGADWAKRVDDVPAAFFSRYRVGDVIKPADRGF